MKMAQLSDDLADSMVTAELMRGSGASTAVKVIVPLLVSFTAGTGGIITTYNAKVLNRWIYDTYIHVESCVVGNVDTHSPAELVANIRDALAINMSDLADLFGVTRPTAYAWLEGQEPKPGALMRLQHLSRVADVVKQTNIARLDKLIHRPVSNGRSLLDMLKADEDTSEVLATLREIAEKEVQTRHEPKGSGKHLRSLNDVLGESSMTIYERS